eukprot:GHVQ01028078.1.p1 GENE.GHVQ01028078.1~~GHVQ01028078.1.p1  ORF type:complete len:117 (+),score=13.39 GHVQ01028078.1:436-786(+)
METWLEENRPLRVFTTLKKEQETFDLMYATYRELHQIQDDTQTIMRSIFFFAELELMGETKALGGTISRGEFNASMFAVGIDIPRAIVVLQELRDIQTVRNETELDSYSTDFSVIL